MKQLNIYDAFLIYFDVACSFTNILQEKIINIANKTIFENYPFVKFTRKEYQKLFEIATSEHTLFSIVTLISIRQRINGFSSRSHSS